MTLSSVIDNARSIARYAASAARDPAAAPSDEELIEALEALVCERGLRPPGHRERDEVQEVRRRLDDEREARRRLDDEVQEARRRLDDEREAHARLRAEHQRLEPRVAVLTAQLADARREVAVRSTALAARNRELEARRRDLQVEVAKHRSTRERLAAAEAARDKLTQELAQERRRGDEGRPGPHGEAPHRRAAEVAAQERVALTAAQERVDILGKEATAAAEEAVAGVRALQQEVNLVLTHLLRLECAGRR